MPARWIASRISSGAGGSEVTGLALADLLAGARKRLEKNRRRHPAVDSRRQGDALDHPRCRRVHRHRHEAVGLRNQLAPLHLLALAHHRPCRLADMLRQRDDHHRRKGKLLYRQVPGVVLGLRRMNAVGEAADAGGAR